MNDFRNKIAMLRRFYSPERYSANPLAYRSLQRTVVEGREKEFIPLIGFRDQTAWSKGCAGKRRFTEAELKFIARFFHLDDLVEPGEEGWELLTDLHPHEHFAVRLVRKGYGTLQSFRGAFGEPAGDAATLADFVTPLLGFVASHLDIDVVAVTGERGAAERDELEEQGLLAAFPAWTPYAYRICADQAMVGHLYLLEISSAIGGGHATCALVAPSRLHAGTFFKSAMYVPATPAGLPATSFKMSDRQARCTTIAFVTEQALPDIPAPLGDTFFAALSLEAIRLLAAQLADMPSAVFRGMGMLGLKA